jgi:uncharacterized membrane protein
MLSLERVRRTTLIGYAVACLGVLVFTQLERIERMGSGVSGAASLGSLGATLVGFLTAIVGSAIWARRATNRQPLKIAASIAVATLLITFAVGINIHGPSAILMFVVMFSVVNVVSVLIASGW